MRVSGYRSKSTSPAGEVSQSEQDDLGFGDKITADSSRLIRRDGSFNIERRGQRAWTPYQDLVEMSWLKFILLALVSYYFINMLFAFLFYLCGGDSFSGLRTTDGFPLYFELLFFSIQTFTTVGYGTISPIGPISNVIATLNAFAGLLGFALATGLLFARFAKPKAQILFSENALLSPYQTNKSFQFRIVNRRDNKLINLRAEVIMTWIEFRADGKRTRRFRGMPLERSEVSMFPLNWTIVHHIKEDSPLNGLSIGDLKRIQAEFIVLIEGFDQTFAQNVHANGSYTALDLVDNVRFSPMYFPDGAYTLIDLDKINAYYSEEEE